MDSFQEYHELGSAYISKLYEYCSKFQLSAPVWSFDSQVDLQQNNWFKATINIEGNIFESPRLKSKHEAKKAAAALAYRHYIDSGNSFFTTLSQISYSQRLQTLCTVIDIPLPYYIIQGAFVQNIAPFKAQCYVAGVSFASLTVHPKKQAAKEEVAQVAYEGLLNDPMISSCYKQRIPYQIDPALLHNQFKAHFPVHSLYTESMDNSMHSMHSAYSTNMPMNHSMNSTNMPMNHSMNSMNMPMDNSMHSMNSYQQNGLDQQFMENQQCPTPSYRQPPTMTEYYPIRHSKSNVPNSVIAFEKPHHRPNHFIEIPVTKQRPLDDARNIQTISPISNDDELDIQLGFNRNVSSKYVRTSTRTNSPPMQSVECTDDMQSVVPFYFDKVGASMQTKVVETDAVQDNRFYYTDLLYDMSDRDTSFGKPYFSTRKSPFSPDEYIAQLTFGGKYFISSSSYPTKDDACEDVAHVAYDELMRLEALKRTEHHRAGPVHSSTYSTNHLPNEHDDALRRQEAFEARQREYEHARRGYSPIRENTPNLMHAKKRESKDDAQSYYQRKKKASGKRTEIHR